MRGGSRGAHVCLLLLYFVSFDKWNISTTQKIRMLILKETNSDKSTTCKTLYKPWIQIQWTNKVSEMYKINTINWTYFHQSQLAVMRGGVSRGTCLWGWPYHRKAASQCLRRPVGHCRRPWIPCWSQSASIHPRSWCPGGCSCALDHGGSSEICKVEWNYQIGNILVHRQWRARRALSLFKVESQKGTITIQRCSIENQKGTITIDIVQQ